MTQVAGEGCKFSVMKAPLGTAASLEFRSEGFVIIDLGEHRVKGKVPEQEYGYSRVVSWTAGEGTWGLQLDDRRFDFLSDQVDAIRAEMLHHFPLNTKLRGVQIVPLLSPEEDSPLPVEE